MTQETAIERLDYSKPPPGYRVGRKGFCLYAQEGEHVGIVTRIASSTAEALAAAWAHYKAEHDPPGMDVLETNDEYADGWCFTVGEMLWSAEWSEVDARAAAWAWYDHRHAFAAAVEKRDGASAWPACLTWVAEVERWLQDGAAEMPEVLRG